MCRGNTNQCVQFWRALAFPPRPALMPFHCAGLTWNSSWIIPSGRAIALCQLCSPSSQLSFIRCQFLPLCIIYPADFSFTSCYPPRLLHHAHDNRLGKKKSYTSASLSCVFFETSVVIICLLGLRDSDIVIANILPSSFS